MAATTTALGRASATALRARSRRGASSTTSEVRRGPAAASEVGGWMTSTTTSEVGRGPAATGEVGRRARSPAKVLRWTTAAEIRAGVGRCRSGGGMAAAAKVGTRAARTRIRVRVEAATGASRMEVIVCDRSTAGWAPGVHRRVTTTRTGRAISPVLHTNVRRRAGTTAILRTCVCNGAGRTVILGPEASRGGGTTTVVFRTEVPRAARRAVSFRTTQGAGSARCYDTMT